MRLTLGRKLRLGFGAIFLLLLLSAKMADLKAAKIEVVREKTEVVRLLRPQALCLRR